MNPLRSIRWRLQLWYGALFAGVLVVLGVTAYRFEAEQRLERIDDELLRLGTAIVPTVRSYAAAPRGGRSQGLPKPPTTDPVLGTNRAVGEAETARGFYWGIWTRFGTPFSASANAPLPLPAPAVNENGFRQRGEFREIVANPQPGDYTVVGRSIGGEMDQLRRFGWMLAGGGLVAFAVVLTIGWWLVNRALRPVSAIGEAATQIATGDLARRIDTRDTDSELGQLATVLNATFARLEASFAQQARFTADAAHELRTPVTVMLAHVQNALATPGASEEHREAFEACQRAAQRMRRLIEALLQLARLDAGQDVAAQARVDLAEIARDSVDHVRPLAEQRQVTLYVEGETAECLGAADLLGQVVTNLVTNAIHHNRAGGEARVSTRVDGDHAELTVADNGPGIPEEHVAHIFNRFYRVDKARTAALGRTGLGLAIVRAIVDAHGGEITVRSVVGEGTTFTVRVPRASA